MGIYPGINGWFIMGVGKLLILILMILVLNFKEYCQISLCQPHVYFWVLCHFLVMVA